MWCKWRGVAQPGSAPEWGSLNKAKSLSNPQVLIDKFLTSRRQELSPRTIEFYYDRLIRAKEIIGTNITAQDINAFFKYLPCSNGNKHAYWRALTVFYRWLYSPKSGLGLNPQDNPMLLLDAPKVEKRILPSLTPDEINYLIDQADSPRDKAIISLFADSGARLNELANIRLSDINFNDRLIKILGKGNRERYIVFGNRTGELLKQWIDEFKPTSNLWNLDRWAIINILRRLQERTGIKCNPHTFRRSFASILAKRGVDSLHIMRLGGWSSLDMVDKYTKSVKFEDSLKLYSPIVS